MKSGLKKVRPDHRDYSFHKSFGTTDFNTATLPPEFNVDANLWTPDQHLENCLFSPCIPALPFGCTDYTQADLCVDEDGKLYNPLDLEAITHANANGGADLRASLKAAKQAFGRTAYFAIQAAPPLDWFDAIRIAMYSSLPEKRAVSLGTAWYREFEAPTNGILPTPQDFTSVSTWHNHAIVGWKTINGQQYLISKSWQGPNYGDKGFVYLSRALTNSLMAMSGAGAFTLSKVAPQQILPVDLSVVQTIVSFIRALISSFNKPQPMPPLPSVSPVPSEPQQPTGPTVDDFCHAIQEYEGYYAPGENKDYPLGTPAYRNRNPMNLRCMNPMKGGPIKPFTTAIAVNNNFCVFPDYQTGFNTGKQMIINACTGKSKIYSPDMTIKDFFALYSPREDKNDPDSYARWVGQHLGVDYQTFKIKQLV